jgi:hypothetical protein
MWDRALGATVRRMRFYSRYAAYTAKMPHPSEQQLQSLNKGKDMCCLIPIDWLLPRNRGGLWHTARAGGRLVATGGNVLTTVYAHVLHCMLLLHYRSCVPGLAYTYANLHPLSHMQEHCRHRRSARSTYKPEGRTANCTSAVLGILSCSKFTLWSLPVVT